MHQKRLNEAEICNWVCIVWTGTELLQLPEQWSSWFMSPGDWCNRHYTPKLFLMKPLSLKVCQFHDTVCKLFQVLLFSERDKKTPTRMWQCSSRYEMKGLVVYFPLHSVLQNKPPKLLETSRGFFWCVEKEVSAMRNFWTSCSNPFLCFFYQLFNFIYLLCFWQAFV